MADLDPAEKAFIQFIKGFTAENVRDAITHDVDLGRLVQEEYGEDLLGPARQYAALYDATHPGKRQQLSDLETSARKVVEWLKVNPKEAPRADLAFEIETYASYRTIGAELGLVAEGTTMPYVAQTEHVGYAWLRKNIQSLASVILG